MITSTSIGTDLYPHMPIILATMCVARAQADSPADFRLLGEQSSQKWEIPCHGRR